MKCLFIIAICVAIFALTMCISVLLNNAAIAFMLYGLSFIGIILLIDKYKLF